MICPFLKQVQAAMVEMDLGVRIGSVRFLYSLPCKYQEFGRRSCYSLHKPQFTWVGRNFPTLWKWNVMKFQYFLLNLSLEHCYTWFGYPNCGTQVVSKNCGCNHQNYYHDSAVKSKAKTYLITCWKCWSSSLKQVKCLVDMISFAVLSCSAEIL